MIMLKRILIPLDGSALAEAALPAARAVARLTGASVMVMQAVEAPETGEDGAAPGAAAYLAAVAGRLADDGVIVCTHVATGPAALAIIEAAGEADLTVMATHGRGGVGRWALGSVADQVMQGAPSPVLLVRAEQAQPLASGYPRHVLVPLDGSELAEHALPMAMLLADRAGAEVILTHIVTPLDDLLGDAGENLLALASERARAYLHEVSQRLVQPGVTLHTDVHVGSAVEGILTAAEARRADLIVMSTHGRGGLGRWVYGSVADHIARAASVPVLLVRVDARTSTKTTAMAHSSDTP
jgi:nucleotide-binding universal stress UspA family protein